MNNKELLNSILEQSQLGQTFLKSALAVSMRPSLRKALEGQLKEYKSIEAEAFSIAFSRGWELEETEPALRRITSALIRLGTVYGCTDSKLAAMTIRHNTRGMIRGLRDLHQVVSTDQRITNLSQKYLDSETAVIRQLQGFL